MRNVILSGLNLIVGLLNEDDRIKTIFSANEDEIDFNKKDLYPISNVRVDSNDFNSNDVTFEVTIIDQRDTNKRAITNKLNGNDNRWDNWSLSYDVLRSIINKIDRLQDEDNISFVSSSNPVLIDNAFSNGLDGYSVLITLNFPNNLC
tara:strand:- start:1908 stop:2351 length:444 start_codon:yes stop_codon:yes gene_type:complete